jgi:signal transduction histidine kinase
MPNHGGIRLTEPIKICSIAWTYDQTLASRNSGNLTVKRAPLPSPSFAPVRQSPTESGLVSQGLEIIERNARIQTELIADLLDLSRIVSGNARVDMTPINLAVVLSQVVINISEM